MDSEKDNEAERQAEEKRQQDVEALKRRAAGVAEKLTLQAEFQNRRVAEALYRQVAEELNSHIEAQDHRLKRIEERQP